MKRVILQGYVGWLHGETGMTGVVLCAPGGHEAMWSHRAWRHLADDLAAAGLPALRFDYPGSGDSDGSEDDPRFVEQAVASIVAAAARLRELAGVERVVLCGLRLGASLAVLAAEAMATDHSTAAAGLILLAPAANGRAYLRELRALHGNWLSRAIPDLVVAPAQDGAQQVLAFRLVPETVAKIGALNLAHRQACPAPRVLLLDAWPGTASAVAALAAIYQAAGAQVQLGAFDEYPGMMQSAEYAAVPERAWRQVVDWVRPAAGPAQPQKRSGAPRVRRTPGLHVDGGFEQPVWLGGGRLFGILCVPSKGRSARTAVIFPNTGGNHHVGDGRIFVTLSRQLARRGVAALRLDVSALGDSPAAARQMNIPSIYSPPPCADVSAAVEWVRARGFRRIVLAGVCSGAYLSLHAALANEGVNGLVLANLVKFRWDLADDATAGSKLQSIRGYLVAARKRENWQRLLRGEIRAWPIASSLAGRFARRAAERHARLMARLRGAADTTTVSGFACHAMAELNRRGVHIDFLYGKGDVGLEEAAFCFGGDMKAISALERVKLRTLPCMDHSLFLPESREAFGEFLVRHVMRQEAELSAETAMTGGNPRDEAPASEPSSEPSVPAMELFNSSDH